MPTKPQTHLDTAPNPAHREYEIAIEAPEFTCLCPMTAQPDFATIRISYVPAERIVELKSLKLYLWSYRDMGIFHEAAVNKILDDIIAAVAPRRCTVVGDFNVRGGIRTVVTASYDREQEALTRA